MHNWMVDVPVSVLLDPCLTTAAKVVWMALRLKPTATPAELAALTSLSRHTTTSGLDQVRLYKQTPGGRRVRVPRALLAERPVGARAKVLYGLLQATPHFRGQSGEFTFTSLCAHSQLRRTALKRAVTELVGAHWITISQANRLAPLRFTLGSPELAQSLAEAAMAGRRLRRARFDGEAIMQEYLSLLIDSDQFTDNARPGFLVNPLTRERLEFDRFYPPNVAFEFNGVQHERATAKFTQQQVDAQRLRDLIKAGICLYQGIQLIIIRAGDLTLEGMTKRIGQSMPLRPLAGHEPLIDLLEDAGLDYRISAERA